MYLYYKNSCGSILFLSRRLTWVIYVFWTIFVKQLTFMVLVGGLHEDLRKDPSSWTHVISTLTRKLVRSMLSSFHIDFPTTLIDYSLQLT